MLNAALTGGIRHSVTLNTNHMWAVCFTMVGVSFQTFDNRTVNREKVHNYSYQDQERSVDQKIKALLGL